MSFRVYDSEPMILQADGTPFKAPELLNLEELRIVQTIFGMTKRNGWKPVRGEFRFGVQPPDSPVAIRLNDMQRRGLLRLIIGKQLSRKDFARFKKGDYSKAALVAQITREGVDAYIATARDAQDKKDAAVKAEGARA